MTDHRGVHVLLTSLLEHDSVDQIRAEIQAWLQANPRPTTDEIVSRVDEALSGWYRGPEGYDPRVIGPVLDELTDVVKRIVRESGKPDTMDDFQARNWVHEWVHLYHPAFGGRAPVHVLHTADGVAQVRQLLAAMQSGAFM